MADPLISLGLSLLVCEAGIMTASLTGAIVRIEWKHPGERSEPSLARVSAQCQPTSATGKPAHVPRSSHPRSRCLHVSPRTRPCSACTQQLLISILRLLDPTIPHTLSCRPHPALLRRITAPLSQAGKLKPKQSDARQSPSRAGLLALGLRPPSPGPLRPEPCIAPQLLSVKPK